MLGTGWHMAGNVGYCLTLLPSAIWHLWLSTSTTVHLTVKIILNCHKFNSNCLLKEVLRACKNFGFIKMHTSGCTLDAIHFTSMATGHNRFSVVEELSSRAFCKIAAPVSLRRYPELPDLSCSPLPSYICGKIICSDSIFIWYFLQAPIPITDLTFLSSYFCITATYYNFCIVCWNSLI
jgi:hypothetical protein